MAIPDFFDKTAVAVSQAVSGLDKEVLADKLGNVIVGLTIHPDADTREGRALADLFVRLAARLYPSLVIRAPGSRRLVAELHALAQAINPAVELTRAGPTVEVVVGQPARQSRKGQRIFAGCTGWTGKVSTQRPLGCGNSRNPFGSGVAACLAAANVFRHVFLPQVGLDDDAEWSLLPYEEQTRTSRSPKGDFASAVLVGGGAIGNAAVWTLSRVPMHGKLTIVDLERIDLGNLQRYVMAERSAVNAEKSRLLAARFGTGIHAEPFQGSLEDFLAQHGHQHDRMLLALDSAKDRRAAQASLPRWVANGWTQPGDLGVSTHDFLAGACVSCLYLPDSAALNEDQIVAEAFGVPELLQLVRTLLHLGSGAPRQLLEAIAAAHQLKIERLLPFEGRPLRALYTEGFCGGAVIPLARAGQPRGDVHVPLAHQSALAGVMLGAAAVRHALGGARSSTITQVDLSKPLPSELTRPAGKAASGRCICQDTDFRTVFLEKYAFSQQ